MDESSGCNWVCLLGVPHFSYCRACRLNEMKDSRISQCQKCLYCIFALRQTPGVFSCPVHAGEGLKPTTPLLNKHRRKNWLKTDKYELFTFFSMPTLLLLKYLCCFCSTFFNQFNLAFKKKRNLLKAVNLQLNATARTVICCTKKYLSIFFS